jgi:hypothetical protein
VCAICEPKKAEKSGSLLAFEKQEILHVNDLQDFFCTQDWNCKHLIFN